MSDQQRVDRLKAWIRARMAGGCRMLSDGDQCACPLCDADALASLVAENSRLRQVIDDEYLKQKREQLGP